MVSFLSLLIASRRNDELSRREFVTGFTWTWMESENINLLVMGNERSSNFAGLPRGDPLVDSFVSRNLASFISEMLRNGRGCSFQFMSCREPFLVRHSCYSLGDAWGTCLGIKNSQLPTTCSWERITKWHYPGYLPSFSQSMSVN